MPYWELHPSGDELLVALSGEFEVLLQDGSNDTSATLSAGQVFLVPFGVWHRVRVKTPGEILFITPGKGTQHRPV
jgi:quercetin dioxygenase-like cupin family protein